jgi:LPS-assembly lipoprotein
MTRLNSITVAALGFAALALGGCGGFTPLYASQGVTPKLSAIEVQRSDGRASYLMGQYLDDAMPRDRDQAPVYRLTYRNSERRVPLGARIDNVATRYEVDMASAYFLTEIATNKIVTKGVVHVNVTYDSADAPYAALGAAQDGERRVAEQAADRIQLELATFFASPRPLPKTDPVATNTNIFSERFQPGAVQSTRERALGEPTAQGGQNDVVGETQPATTTPDTETQPFSPSQDPSAIKTLPDPDGGGQ